MNRLAALLVGAAILIWVAAPAGALGVDGVSLTPVLPEGADGYPVLRLATEPVTVEARVRNRNNDVRVARVYAVSAQPTDESFALRGAGTAEWLGLPDEEISLQPGEERLISFTVEPRDVPEEASHVALVLEAGTGSTVVTRAATVVQVNAMGTFGAPIAPFLVAALLLVLLVLAHLGRKALERRRGGLIAQPA